MAQDVLVLGEAPSPEQRARLSTPPYQKTKHCEFMSALIPSSSISRTSTGPEIEDTRALPLLSIGFRPFFLMATLVAVFWIPLWLFALTGQPLAPYFPPVALHAHEMLFGFAGAVISGFLLTAGANWTQRKTTSATSLALLVALFLLGRVLLLVPGMPLVLVAVVDLAYFPALTIVLGIPILQAGSIRNVPFLGMLLVLFTANAVMHLDAYFLRQSGISPFSYGLGQNLALHVITLMMLVMGARVIPMFTRNATRAQGIASDPMGDRFVLGIFAVAALWDLGGPALLPAQAAPILGLTWLFAGCLHFYRMRTWGTRHATAPLLWILHFSYGAIGLSFVLRGLARLEWFVPISSAIHLLTVGGVGGLCLGMMTRVSLGHSGRMLVAPRTMSAAFALLVLAALIRVVVPVLFPDWAQQGYQLSGTCWTGAFLLLLHFGLPIWLSPRPDRTPRTVS